MEAPDGPARPAVDRGRRIEELRAAAARKDRRRRWAFGAVVLLAAAGTALGVGFHKSGSSSSMLGDPALGNPAKAAGTPTVSPSIAPAGSGPELIALEAGTVLALPGPVSGAPVDGIQCQTQEQVAYHIHAHLAIYVNGVLRPVPTGIGMSSPVVTQDPDGPFAQAGTCYYWLHTHTNDGVIHIESPTSTTYTLGQFFALWGQPLNATTVGPATGAVSTYVDGKPFTGDPATVPLNLHSKIQLDVGTAVPPQPVDWAASKL